MRRDRYRSVMDAALSPARHGLLGRFDARGETEYRAWFMQRFRPLGIAMGTASAVAWVFNAPLVHLFVGSDHVVLAYVLCWGVNLPALVAGVLYLRRPHPRIAVATALVMLTAVDTIAILLPSLAGPGPDATTYALAATFYGLLAPVIQLPFRHTVAVAGVVLVTAFGMLNTLPSAPDVGSSFVLATLLTVVSTLFIGPAMAFVNERDLRARFLGERMIAHQRKLIRRYAPSSVVSRIELGDDTVDQPQRRRVTVFSSDVVGFTAMADRVDPEALAHIINDYLGSVSDLIESHGGTVTEFAGDGVMAIFGAPEESDAVDQVSSAIGAARELQASLAVWSRSWHQHGTIEPTSARIGINTGMVSVGTFGSAIRATYTGIGLQMNIASRVQAQAEPGRILLSNTSWHLVKDSIPCEPRGEVMVKGVHFPIELYEPIEGAAAADDWNARSKL
jgi:class 3 adenylate cyclase